MKNKNLKRRIIEISCKHNLSHLGSCLTAVDIIDEIFKVKKPNEKFVLSSGHAGLALYVVLEKYTKKDAETIFLHHGVHPDRCSNCGIDCSSGSLGHGLPIAVGMALADRSKNVYCLISDGEMAEGSIWEAFRIAKEQKLENLVVRININGWGAYKEIDEAELRGRTYNWAWNRHGRFVFTSVNQFPFLKGQDAHYHTMTEEEYKEAMEILK